ncbi:MAG: hypothetical protein IJW40_07590 [Clostridia bacterium]|nr:hypothetical protein [Clostridia bacterium]
MKYIGLFLLVLILIACISCTVPGGVDAPPSDESTQEDAQNDFRDQYYSEFGDRPYPDIFAEPLSEDTPLETLQALYPALNIRSYEDYCFVVYCPKGTPDYTPFLSESLFPDWMGTEGVTLTVPETIDLDFESFEIVLEKAEAPYELLFVRAPRIEKWTGDAWVRIHYLHADASAKFVDFFKESDVLSRDGIAYGISGTERATVTVSREEWITPVETGKYRVMMYVGYEAAPMYAEFTITN